MELLDALETLVKNPLSNSLPLENLLNKKLFESYRSSNTHRIRELIAEKRKFSDMSHVFPFTK